jgi:hypothetical protein
MPLAHHHERGAFRICSTSSTLLLARVQRRGLSALSNGSSIFQHTNLAVCEQLIEGLRALSREHPGICSTTAVWIVL